MSILKELALSALMVAVCLAFFALLFYAAYLGGVVYVFYRG